MIDNCSCALGRSRAALVRLAHCSASGLIRPVSISGREHADISADVGIPDIAVGIDSEAIGPGVVARKAERCDPAVAQATKTRTAHHSEPDGAVAGDHEPTETCILLSDPELGKLAVPQ